MAGDCENDREQKPERRERIRCGTMEKHRLTVATDPEYVRRRLDIERRAEEYREEAGRCGGGRGANRPDPGGRPCRLGMRKRRRSWRGRAGLQVRLRSRSGSVNDSWAAGFAQADPVPDVAGSE